MTAVSSSLPVYMDGVRKTFTDPVTGRPLVALQSLTLTVEPGSLVALIGPDGAGKTTALRLMCGLLRPDSGRIVINGMDVVARPQAVQNHIGYMPQKFGLYEDLSVQENLNLYADLYGVPTEERPARYERLLSMTGLSPFTGRPAGKLSGGMKQKLGLACTLLSRPPLLLLDEPTVGVDPLSRRELWAILLQAVREFQMAVVVSTAYLDEAALCDDVYILHQGRLLAHGTPDELTALSAGHCYTVKAPAAVPPRVLQAALIDDDEYITDAVPQGDAVRCFSRTGHIEKLQAYRHFPSLTMTAVPPTLEDTFMMLLKAQSPARPAVAGFAIDYAKTAVSDDTVDVAVNDVMRTFGDFIAVNHVSFSVRRGEIFGLLGPNGAGKSTTFRMLCGLLPVTSGSLSVLGLDLRKARALARAGIGYVAQKFSLYGTLSVEENLSFFAGAYGLSPSEAQQRVKDVLVQFDLLSHRRQRADELPGGYKQRLSMAAALMHKPKVLFLDEPTSGIDPPARRIFWRQITALAAAGTTIIVTTHFMEEAEYCDRILIQDRGRMIALGTPSDIRRRAGNPPSMNEAFIAIVEEQRRQGGASS